VKTNRLLRLFRARPRLLMATGVALAVFLLLPQEIARQPVTRALVAWNAGTALFIALIGLMILRSTEERMQRRARIEDEGRRTVLMLAVIAVLASLAAIGGELLVVKDVQGSMRYLHIALAACTIATSWAFVHLVFALHYAHDFYSNVAHGRESGLQFAGNERPDYGDFVYFAAIIGTSGQTADVSLTTRAMRRIGTLHCVLSFFFNTTVLALMINIAASLI
jgi:uncharacterized membrane protein